MNMISAVLAIIVGLSFGQEIALPERGSILDLQGMRRVYIATEDTDAYERIRNELKKYEGLEIVSSAKAAQFVLEYRILNRDVAPGRRGADMHVRSQLEAVALKDGGRLIAWAETETLDMDNGMSFNRPNEINLTRNFIKAHKKAFPHRPAKRPPVPSELKDKVDDKGMQTRP